MLKRRGGSCLTASQQFAPSREPLEFTDTRNPMFLRAGGARESPGAAAAPTGEEEKDHPGLPGLLSDGEPLRRGELPPAALGPPGPWSGGHSTCCS